MKKETILTIIASLFIFLFMYAAVSKLADYQTFKVRLGQSPLLTPIAGFVAWFIPVIEILISISLTITRLRLLGLYASFGLMVMFTVYIIVITRFSDHIPCSCGGIMEKMSWNGHLLFNVAFIALGLLSIMLYSKDISLQQNQE